MARRNSGNKLQFAESIKATNPHTGYKKVRYTDKNTFPHCDNNFVSLVSIIRCTENYDTVCYKINTQTLAAKL